MIEDVPEKHRFSLHWAWVILAICFVNVFTNFSVRIGFSVILPEMIKDLGLSRTAGASIFNAQSFMFLSVNPITGYLADRIGPRRVITFGMMILTTGIFLMGRVESLLAACLSYAVVGLGATGIWTPCLVVLQRWFAPHRKGLALGILSTGYGLGLAVIGIVFPIIVSHYNWRYAWYAYALLGLIVVGLNTLCIRNDPNDMGLRQWGSRKDAPLEKQTKAVRSSRPSLPSLFRYRNFWLIGLSYGAMVFSLYGITTFMVDYATFQIGLPTEKASFVATIHGVCQVVGVLTIVPFSDYFGRKKTILMSDFFIGAAITGILFSGNSPGMLYVGVGVLAVFYGAHFPLYGASAGDFFPKEIMGTVLGAWTPFSGFGIMAVNWVSGILRDTTGSYMYSFTICLAMAALGFFLFSLVRRNGE